MARPKTRYAKSGDVHIAYGVMESQGPFDLVYVPTFLGAMEHYWSYHATAAFFDRLGDCGRLALFDRRGTGMSDVPVDGGFTLEDQMDDVLAVMDAAGIERAGLFAQLEGCMMATLFAGTHPDRVASLALYCPFARLTRAEDYPFGLTPEERIEQLVEPTLAHWGDGIRGSAIAPSLADDPDFVEWFGALERLTAGPGVIRRQIELSNETDVRAILPQVRVPTLVVSRPGTAFYEAGPRALRGGPDPRRAADRAGRRGHLRRGRCRGAARERARGVLHRHAP